MTTAAFWQQKLNTQLASWTELRHDNLLYAKQSYTGVPICSYPYSYVEPFPEFYEVMMEIGESGYNYFQNFNFSDPYIQSTMLQYFTDLKNISDTLRMISQKELDEIPLTPEEVTFLKNMLFEVSTYTGTDYDGWYPKLLYDDKAYDYESLLGKNFIVADIHTTPADCGGSMMGWVKHVGTGSVDVGVFIAKLPGGEECTFIGPMRSYYDYTTIDWLRLTDDEWKNEYLFSSARLDWVNVYLADSSGNSRGPGGTLVTSLIENPNQELPVSHLVAETYPNPFNPSVVIKFSVPYDLTNSLTELTIYDIQGQKIKTLVKEILPSGNYVAKWEALTDDGVGVSSGVYLYILKVASQQVTGKMVYQK